MKKTTIRCPHCGREFLPGEIYLPKEFLGQPTDIIRGFNGDILAYEGNDMNTKETYICEECNTKFSVDAVVTFRVEAVEEENFDDDFVVSISE